MLFNIGLGIKAKKWLYEGVIVPTALYGAEENDWWEYHEWVELGIKRGAYKSLNRNGVGRWSGSESIDMVWTTRGENG